MRARSTLPLLCSLAIISVDPQALARGSLYRGRAPRPGPDVLYGAPVVAPRLDALAPAVAPQHDVLSGAAGFAPQLEYVGGWTASPMLGSGASAYRTGESLCQ